MKTLIILFLLLFCFTSNIVNAQTYGLDNTDPAVFTQFRIPNTDLRSLWFNTNLSFNSQKALMSIGQPFDNLASDSYNSEFHYDLSPYYLLLCESEDMYLKVQANLEGSVTHNYSYNESNQLSIPNKTKEDDYSASINMNSTYNNYINSGDFFYSIGSSVNVEMDELKTDIISGTYTGSYSNTKSQNYSVSLGLGIGKLRNVTPVVTAIRFQERMKQLGMINNNLSDKVIEGLADQFYKQPYYSDIHVRADKYFWQGIDNVLSEDGVSTQGLNMYAAAYLQEAVNELRFFRQEGLETGLNLQLNYLNNYFYGSPLNERLTLLLNPYIEFSHQLNLDSQINFGLSLSGGPVLTAHSILKQYYTIDLNAGYSYELTDRVIASASNDFQYGISNANVQSKTIGENLSLNLSYFIEDELLLNASYGWAYTSNNYSSTKNENLTNSLIIGFTYYIGRAFIE
jgi:hypothetical protein